MSGATGDFSVKYGKVTEYDTVKDGDIVRFIYIKKNAWGGSIPLLRNFIIENNIESNTKNGFTYKILSINETDTDIIVSCQVIQYEKNQASVVKIALLFAGIIGVTGVLLLLVGLSFSHIEKAVEAVGDLTETPAGKSLVSSFSFALLAGTIIALYLVFKGKK